MTELELRNFIKDNKVEWSFIDVGDGCVIDVIMFIEFNLLPAFLHLISNYLNNVSMLMNVVYEQTVLL